MRRLWGLPLGQARALVALTLQPHARRWAWTAAPAEHPLLQRYVASVEAKRIQHDDKQWAVLAQLARLHDDLAAHAAKMAAFRQRAAQYEATFDARFAQLLAIAEARDAQREQQATQSSPTAAGQGWGEWALGRLLGSELAQREVGASSAQRLTLEQQKRLREAEVRSQVIQELGRAPVPPPQPQGVYIAGSVGSGKTLLMDMFFSTIAAAPWGHELFARRMHFNAAMQEFHQRLHYLDQREKDAAGQLAQLGWGQGASAATTDDEGSQDDDDGPAEQTTAPRSRQGIFKFWDEGVMRQKQAKQAVLAIRRHLRQARLGRVKPEVLAVANASNMVTAASSLIRSRTGVVSTGWHADGGPRPALICFDEMQVADVFSAVTLKALTEGLVKAGGTLVVTSNRRPDELPRHGLHEAMFDNFIACLVANCRVLDLSTAHDYREVLLRSGGPQAAMSGAASAIAALPAPPYLHPLDGHTRNAIDQLWEAVTHGAGPKPQAVQVAFGRQLWIPAAVGGVARFDFSELCGVPTGPSDFMALARNYHTLVLTNVPTMSMRIRDQARRFITLVDELYNAHTRLLVSAEAPPHGLFSAADGTEEPILDLEQLQFESAVEGSKLRRDLTADGGVAPVATSQQERDAARAALGGAEEQFAFKRAVSRLLEMQSMPYLQAWARLHHAHIAGVVASQRAHP